MYQQKRKGAECKRNVLIHNLQGYVILLLLFDEYVNAELTKPTTQQIHANRSIVSEIQRSAAAR